MPLQSIKRKRNKIDILLFQSRSVFSPLLNASKMTISYFLFFSHIFSETNQNPIQLKTSPLSLLKKKKNHLQQAPNLKPKTYNINWFEKQNFGRSEACYLSCLKLQLEDSFEPVLVGPPSSWLEHLIRSSTVRPQNSQELRKKPPENHHLQYHSIKCWPLTAIKHKSQYKKYNVAVESRWRKTTIWTRRASQKVKE